MAPGTRDACNKNVLVRVEEPFPTRAATGDGCLIAPGCKEVHTDLPRQSLLPTGLGLFDSDSHHLNKHKERNLIPQMEATLFRLLLTCMETCT